jgi:hypothetical protein
MISEGGFRNGATFVVNGITIPKSEIMICNGLHNPLQIIVLWITDLA